MEEEVVKSISVPEKFYNDLKKKVMASPKKKIMYQFQDDDFKSLVWMLGDAMWCKDRIHGMREIHPMSAEWLLSMDEENLSLRMRFVKHFVELGIDIEKSIEIVWGVNDLIGQLGELNRQQQKEEYDALADKISEILAFAAKLTLDGKNVFFVKKK